MKTHKGISKRFKLTSGGLLLRKSPGMGHLTGKKSSKSKAKLKCYKRVGSRSLRIKYLSLLLKK
ncbi:MAG: bL35 family ribosomal protein [Candidatus Organicella extenuata]|jgi:ribosomal protein L35|uniref:BL35 family ribosomal protein n=1 Tax=Candidatus Organicella extenuata TaxID=2841811 RepID=A0AA51GE98_9BACT|nr:MAG: bL35 family ribosomal protein [Candidatus Organicella extenuata]